MKNCVVCNSNKIFDNHYVDESLGRIFGISCMDCGSFMETDESAETKWCYVCGGTKRLIVDYEGGKSEERECYYCAECDDEGEYPKPKEQIKEEIAKIFDSEISVAEYDMETTCYIEWLKNFKVKVLSCVE